MKTWDKRRAALLSGVSLALLTSAANAQTASTSSQVDELVVTASRVQRSGFTAPTPTTVVGAEDIKARGITNVVDALNEVPAFRPSQTPAAAARGGAAGSGGSFVDLRGLSAVGGRPTARTLVLVDRRRFVSSNEAGQVDLNLIPTGLVERTDIVTGGASAAWGSDAVAGVVNIVLKDKLQGLEGSIAYGQSDEDDFKEYTASLAGGTSFAGGRGHVIAGFDYTDNKGIPDPYVYRDWGRKAYGNLVLPNVRPAGLPSRNILPDVRISDRMAPGGVIVGGQLDNIEFLSGGRTRIFTPGPLVGGNQMYGGGANDSNAGIYFIGGSNLINPMERFSAMGRVNYDVADNFNVFLEYMHGESKFRGLQASHRDDASLTIRQDNAFLPDSVRAQMVALNLQTITVGRIAYDDNFNFYKLRTDQDTDRLVVGAKGEVFGDWSWDAYYEWGKNNYVQRNQAVETANYLAAVDAVRDAAGNIVCRAGAANSPDAGCVPFNIFGVNSPSQAAVDYVLHLMTNDVTSKQEVAAFTLSGDPISLPAGPVSLAVGFEYRKEQIHSTVDADAAARRYDVTNFQPIRGEYDIKEVFAETVVPLLSDVPLAKSLDLNAAVRRTDYSTSGAVTTWKVGATYEPVADIRLRGTLSRDIRAPNINELFSGITSGRANVTDPRTGNTAQVNGTTGGNPNLTPEEADTFTAGFAYQPGWLPGFRTSVDYYKIKIDEVISTFPAQTVVERCAAGVTELCQYVVRNAAGAITDVNGQYQNFNSLKTSGVDLEFLYQLPQDKFVPGQITLRALGTYVHELTLTDPGGPIDRVGQTVPKWTWNFGVTYKLDRFTAHAQVRYLGKTIFDTTLIGPDDPAYSPTLANSINDNVRPDVAYLNLSAQYDLIVDGGRNLQVFGVVNNVFDRDPPPFGANNATGGVLYDLVGRAFRVGVRFRY